MAVCLFRANAPKLNSIHVEDRGEWREGAIVHLRGLPLITYAPRGRGGGVKPPIHFYCVLHAKVGGGGGVPNSM